MRASSAARSTELSQAARSLDRDGLSLALIDARNTTLRWLAQFEDKGLDAGPAATEEQSFSPIPLYMAGRIGWLQEWWIARNLHPLRAASSGLDSVRLAALDPRMDHAFAGTLDQWRRMDQPPSNQDTRSYLEATLEQNLELLATCPVDDEALYVYRCALQHEDRLSEAFAVAAQALGLPLVDGALAGHPATEPVLREAIWMPPQRMQIGSLPGGWVPANEQWAHEVQLPECEIDAQAVTWAQFVEFADDGAYDRSELWRPESWVWVQAEARRAPRYVEQMRHGVLSQRFGALARVSGRAAACHLTWHEADAWCRWAGRRLPTEVEWEAAAITAASRGWCWGEVWEWIAGSARPWPGGAGLTQTLAPRRVLRGASVWTAARAAHPRQRRFAAAERDELFAGFRSCAV